MESGQFPSSTDDTICITKLPKSLRWRSIWLANRCSPTATIPWRTTSPMNRQTAHCPKTQLHPGGSQFCRTIESGLNVPLARLDSHAAIVPVVTKDLYRESSAPGSKTWWHRLSLSQARQNKPKICSGAASNWQPRQIRSNGRTVWQSRSCTCLIYIRDDEP
jgi:hypothetical protein